MEAGDGLIIKMSGTVSTYKKVLIFGCQDAIVNAARDVLQREEAQGHRVAPEIGRNFKFPAKFFERHRDDFERPLPGLVGRNRRRPRKSSTRDVRQQNHFARFRIKRPSTASFSLPIFVFSIVLCKDFIGSVFVFTLDIWIK